jgi:hypothetical protein
MMSGSSLPPAGWYTDPNGNGLRWWDGERWSEYRQASTKSQPPPGAPNQSLDRSARSGQWPIAVIVTAGLLAAVFVVFIVLGSDSNGNNETQLEADARAQEQVHSAQVAIETYATDHGGRYVGATTVALQHIEPTLPNDLEVNADAVDYWLALDGANGNSFAIVRERSGEMTFVCKRPGVGGCPISGNWAE